MLKDRMWILWFYGQAFHESKLEKPVGVTLGVLGFRGAEQHWNHSSKNFRAASLPHSNSESVSFHAHAPEFKSLHCWRSSSPRKSCFRARLTSAINGQITTGNCWKNSHSVSAAHLGSYLKFMSQHHFTWSDFPKQLVIGSSHFKGIHHWWLLSSFGRSVCWMLLPNWAERSYESL